MTCHSFRHYAKKHRIQQDHSDQWGFSSVRVTVFQHFCPPLALVSSQSKLAYRVEGLLSGLS